MKGCLFCRNTRIYNIHNDYGNHNHTAKDDMLQFFGYQIEDHLKPDDALCNSCMNLMDNVAKLKRSLLPIIFRTCREDYKPINLGKKWAIFASMSFDDEDIFVDARSPTPNHLVSCKRVESYESPVELKFETSDRQRSLSRISLARSDADSEILKAFSKRRPRRKKRGHNWSRRKNGRYSSMSTDTKKSVNYSRRSSLRSRPVSALSTESYMSFYPPDLDVDSPVTIPNNQVSLQYLNGCIQNKRTRSVSKLLEEQITVSLREDELHECGETNCNFICEDIDLMAQHKVTKHKQLALFWCRLCNKKYTSSEDLETHKRTHPEQYPCAICRRVFWYDTDLLEHWQEHVKNSVPCKQCGKRFADKKIVQKHLKAVHKRNIPSRVDYEACVENRSSMNKDFEVRILVQEPKDS